MFTLRKAFICVVMISLAFAMSAVPHAQTTSTISQSTAHIDKIQFRGGYLDNSADQPGRWQEKKNDGTVNYEFSETGFDGNVLTLVGPEKKVRLHVDLGAKAISGEWPGRILSKIYTITDIEFRDVAKPEPAPTPAPAPASPPSEIVIGHAPLAGEPTPASAPTPAPVPAPVPVQPPTPVFVPAPEPVSVPQPMPVQQPAMPSPAIIEHSPYGVSPKTPAPADLTYAAHSKGAFEKVSERAWREVVTDGPAYHFTVIGYDDTSLFLHDSLRDVLIEVQPAKYLARVSVAGESLRDVFKLTDLRPVATSPVVPDGRLSPAERARCADRGGFVERAGLLGAERCTIQFHDGGQSCSDSSQCQGQCRADVGTPMGSPVSGVCQKTDNPFGCFSEVTQGQAGPGLCVD